MRLLEARGYPHASFEQRADRCPRHYPRVMANYRVAHSMAVHLGPVEATTEELRTAMINIAPSSMTSSRLKSPAKSETAA